MKKLYILLSVICYLLPVSLSAQVLWEVSGNSCKGKSYILATNKLVDQIFLDTIPNVFACYGKCKCVVTEYTMQDYEARQALRSAALLPDSVKLSNFLTDEEYETLDTQLKLRLEMGLDQLGRIKPAYLTEMLRTELMREWLGYSEERSMESFFQVVASNEGKPVYGLDEVGETLYMLFDREPMHWQIRDLKQVVESPEQEVRQERTICDMYRMGRLNDIAYQVLGPDNKTSLSYSDYQVYKKRNRVWVKRMRQYLQPGGAFITLDCIYLGGDDGLLQQLRKEGYRVRAVNRGIRRKE